MTDCMQVRETGQQDADHESEEIPDGSARRNEGGLMTTSATCPHGINFEVVWTPANPPNCPPCFDSLSADLDQLELDNPVVRDAAIELKDASEKLKDATGSLIEEIEKLLMED